jgi:DNA topoisomerase VI subunit B
MPPPASQDKSGSGNGKAGDALRREVAVLNRSMEFFTQKELTARMGGGPSQWPAILVKELIDNALDAAEGLRPPVVEVTVNKDGFTVADNGPGLPDEIVEGSLDYNVRVSDKALYVTPTRGQLGNALKCVWAAPFVAHGGRLAAVTVKTGGHRHTVRVSADQIEGCPRIEHVIENGQPVRIGTSVEVAWPGAASYGAGGEVSDFYQLLYGFATFNPHARFTYAEDGHSPEEILPSDTAWRKWRPADRPPPHWYDLGRFRGLVAGKLAAARRDGGRPQTVRAFIAENFCGLSGTVVRGGLLRDCGLEGATLDRLAPGGDLDDALLEDLLAAMKRHARPLKPRTVGVIGRASLTDAVAGLFDADEESVCYRAAALEVGGVPYVLEVAFGFDAIDERLALVTGVNWSPAPKCPFPDLEWQLGDCRVQPHDPCVLVVHLACPRPEFTDTGKTLLRLPDAVREALRVCVTKVTADWKRLKWKAEREDARLDRIDKRDISEALRREKAGFLSIKDACLQVIEEAYGETSGGGARPANARQIMYAARRLVLQRQLTDPEKGKDGFFKKSSSFTQGVLPDFMEENPDLTKRWDVAFDDRGHFAEPHTGRRIGIGTLAVRDYMLGWTAAIPDGVSSVSLNTEVETRGPANRYRFALFVEKEGFDALLANARIQQRFDLALMSTKGMSVTAARQLVERLSGEGVTVLVLHDFDKSGLSILHTLRSDTRRYRYQKKPKVVDLGLRLGDVNALRLMGERVTYATKADPRQNLRRSGATEEECRFLVSGGRPGRWEGRRVELNEMTSPQFVALLEHKLGEAGVVKVVPDGEALAAAYRLQVRRARLQKAIDEAMRGLDDEVAAVPRDLRKKLVGMIDGKEVPWDQALWQFVSEQGGKGGGR